MKLEMQFELDMFVPLRTGQKMLTFDLASPRNAAPPPHVPLHMQQGLLKDDELVFSVIVPPGAAVCSWYTQFNNKIAKFSVDGVTWHSTETLFNTSLTTTPKEVFLGVKIQEVRPDDPACLLGIALTIGIEDAVLYTNWINSGKPMQPSAPQKSDQDRIIENLFATGFVDALKRMTGIEDLDKLQAKAVETGVWQALEKLDKL